MGDDDPEIVIQTPQFEREDGITPDSPPDTVQGFEALKTLSHDSLTALGLRPWDGELYLFPWEWRSDIPDDLMVQSISGETVRYGNEEVVDKRFGVIAYGIVQEPMGENDG